MSSSVNIYFGVALEKIYLPFLARDEVLKEIAAEYKCVYDPDWEIDGKEAFRLYYKGSDHCSYIGEMGLDLEIEGSYSYMKMSEAVLQCMVEMGVKSPTYWTPDWKFI